MAKNLHVRNGKDGYEYTEVIGDGNNGETILIPPGKDNITCTIIAGANSGKFQFTTSTDSAVLAELEAVHSEFDVKIGKLNYHKSNINWNDFGHKAEEICKRRGLNYYIKDSLRAEMERSV